MQPNGRFIYARKLKVSYIIKNKIELKRKKSQPS